MGKKSKRVRNSSSTSTSSSSNINVPKNKKVESTMMDEDVDDRHMIPPALRSPHRVLVEETKDNLQFEDPFVDEIVEDEDEEDWEDDDDAQDVDDDEANHSRKQVSTTTKDGQEELDWIQTQTLNPYYATAEPLEMDPSAYKMHFALKGEWPSLSFDFIPDVWGEGRTRFPHSILAVVGTQADRSNKNSVQIWKLTDLGKIEKDDDDEDVDYDDDDDKESDDDDDDIDYDPILEYKSVPHKGGVNRVRVHNGVVATWSDVGTINLYTIDVESICANITTNSDSTKPQLFHSYHGHSTEGFAMNFSNISHELATGDNDGSIHVHAPDGRSATKLYTSPHSVEDIAWSPTEATVLTAAEAGGLVKIYDTRAPNKAMLTKRACGTNSNTDINALCWSPLVTNLLGTGCDDGMWSVWDLRKLEDPLARFTSHTTPITSMEWHPTDESMLVVSDEVGSFVYDLSVEEEEGNNKNNNNKDSTGNDDDANKNNDLPPQLLFVHSGSPQTKEVHWHPQVTSLLMSTAYDGFHTFIPSNL